ncbi:MAG TPA: trypsin-like peptidase domain-containing protein [Ruminococcus sp.]|nr:trypsin-like peptidase domain-containing protein [Ruminococcus sp.]
MMNDKNMNTGIEYEEEAVHLQSNPYVNEIETAKFSATKKKHTVPKITAFLMAMAIVSGGSIAAYREFAPESKNTSSASAELTEVDSPKSSNALKAEKLSAIDQKDSNNEELTTEEIVDKLLPSVVGIESNFTYSNDNNGYYYGFGFGGNTPSESTASFTGTGVIITDDGYIVTNAHVIYDSEYGQGVSDDISVLLNDGNSYDAKVIGYDTDCDIAVLKINAEGLTPAQFGNSDELKLGEDVVAIGNPLGFDLMNTVTRGIISGKDRQVAINDQSMELIQTDAAINSGNSGGPLINKYGQVIGINSSKMSSNYSGQASIEGIGFAIPSNSASKIIDELMEYGYVKEKAQLGISCQDVTEAISSMYNLPVGVYVTSVSENSAAEKAGIRIGDVITAVDDEDVKTYVELNTIKKKHEAGDTIELTIVREGREMSIDVTLDEADNR